MNTVVLLSGGLDSIVNFKCALDQGEVSLAITFDYGQVAFENEKHAASLCADRHGVPHRVIELAWYKDLVPGPIAGDGDVHSYSDSLPQEKSELLAEAWVPNRNCVFLSIGAAFAEARGAEGVVVGFNREEAEVFPDNSRLFIEGMNKVFGVSTLSGIKVITHTAGLSKKEIVELGIQVGAPLDLVYSCYRRSGDQRMCGLCQSCVRLKSALRENGILTKLKERFAR